MSAEIVVVKFWNALGFQKILVNCRCLSHRLAKLLRIAVLAALLQQEKTNDKQGDDHRLKTVTSKTDCVPLRDTLEAQKNSGSPSDQDSRRAQQRCYGQ